MPRMLGTRLMLPVVLLLSAAQPTSATERYPAPDFENFRCEIDLDQSFPELGTPPLPLGGSVFTFDSQKFCVSTEYQNRVELRCRAQIDVASFRHGSESSLVDNDFPCSINIAPCGFEGASCADGFCTATSSRLVINGAGRVHLNCAVDLGSSPSATRDGG